MWHTRLVADCREPASRIPPMGMLFMIMGQKWRIAPLTAHDHEKPNGWRIKLSTGEANVPCHRAGVAPAVGGKRPGRPAARKRQAGATTAGFCIRLKLFAITPETAGRQPRH